VTTVGYRSWRVAGGTLQAAGFNETAWAPDVTVARCGSRQAERWREHLADLAVPGHDTANLYQLAKLAALHADQFRPTLNCTCGLHAYKTVEHLKSGHYYHRLSVSGLVLLTGQVVEHERGYRAQRGRILALVHDKPQRLRQRLRREYRHLDIVNDWTAAEPIRRRWTEE
jgi:hypothetical protein